MVVHLIPHSHFDAAKLKNTVSDERNARRSYPPPRTGVPPHTRTRAATDGDPPLNATPPPPQDAYYWGASRDLDEGAAQYVLDSVIASLALDEARRFTVSQVGFLARWWARRGPAERALMQRLVTSGQLEVAGGGWAEPDEGTGHLTGLVDQLTRGHRFLQRELGARPRVGWQLDALGHSQAAAALLGRAGLQTLFLGRTPAEDLSWLRGQRALSFAWDLGDEGGRSLPGASSVRAHAAPLGTMAPPDGFDFDLVFGSAPPGGSPPRTRGWLGLGSAPARTPPRTPSHPHARSGQRLAAGGLQPLRANRRLHGAR